MALEKPVKHPADAFTLIELLVVIAIIALLVSILMPSLQKAKEMAKDVVCASNQKSVSYGIFLYAQDYDDQIPVSTMYNPGWYWLHWAHRIGKVADSNETIPSYFRNYNGPLKDTYVRIVTEGYIDFNYSEDSGDESYSTEGAFKCPSMYDQVRRLMLPASRQFSINQLLSRVLGAGNVGEEEPQHSCTRLEDVRGKVALIGDCGLKPAGLDYWPVVAWSYYWGGSQEYSERSFDHSSPWPRQLHVGTPQYAIDFYGHSGGRSIVAFVDGHVDMIKDLKPSDFNPD